MKTGIELIAEERERQIAVKGWTPEHDDEHDMGEMVGAAITYSAHALGEISDGDIDGSDSHEFWPWDKEWWKPSPDPVRNLVKAGALIAAEIDRLQRKEPKLKCCPFCGGAVRFSDRPNYPDGMISIECANSFCEVHPVAFDFVTERQAAEAWNTRA